MMKCIPVMTSTHLPAISILASLNNNQGSLSAEVPSCLQAANNSIHTSLLNDSIIGRNLDLCKW